MRNSNIKTWKHFLETSFDLFQRADTIWKKAASKSKRQLFTTKFKLKLNLFKLVYTSSTKVWFETLLIQGLK